MKAYVYTESGGVDGTELQSFPSPTPDEGEVIVNVDYCSVNNRDTVIMNGDYPDVTTPHILGSDVSGTVVELGDGVDTVEVGDRVVRYPVVGCGNCRHCRGVQPNYCETKTVLDGGFAERVAVNVEHLVHLPDTVSLKTAATLPTAYLTAWSVLSRQAKGTPGDAILVWGGSGGVGSAATQIAANMGFFPVTVTSSAAYCNALQNLGAYPIDRTQNDVLEVVNKRKGAGSDSGIEFTIDTVGGATLKRSIAATRAGGDVFVCARLGGQFVDFDLREIFARHIAVRGTSLGTPTDLERLVRFISRFDIMPPVDTVIPLSEAPVAMKQFERGEYFGNILLNCQL